MKRLIQALATAAICAVFVPGFVAAQVNVNNTGPGSTVTITDDSDCSIDVNNTTGIAVNNNNNQNSSSGGATNSGNTSGGNASSGNSGASNSVNIDFSINNGTPGTTSSGDPCVFAAAPSNPDNPGNGGGPTPTNPPASGGGGGGVVEGTSTEVAALPATGVDEVLPTVGFGALFIGGMAAVTQLAIKGFQFIKLRQ